jgi:hypothetical protein
MTIKHPLDSLSPPAQSQGFILLLALVILLMLTMGMTGAPLNTPAAPYGIISFELARTVPQAQAMLDSWDAQAHLAAAFNLGLDYLFMLVSAGALALGCLLAGRLLAHRRWPLASLAGWLAWGAFAAMLLDAVENVALYTQLLSGASDPWPAVAFICAAIKFALIFLGMLYAFYALAIRLVIPAPEVTS